MISYAQNFEDVILTRALANVKNGFYIDVGAWDPREHSVTMAFYERGWSGVNIEPHPHYFAKIQEQRSRDINLRVAIGDGKEKTATFYAIDGTGLSTFNAEVAGQNKSFPAKKIEVDVRTLNSIFEECASQDVHFLKIDCEGSEEQALRGLDLERFRPWIIVIEATQPGTQIVTFAWEPILTKHRYKFAYFDGLNRFYVADEHSEIVPLVGLPPNVFDGITFAREVEREKVIATLVVEKSELWAKSSEVDELRAFRSSATPLLKRYDQIVNELRSDDGPISLRIVLPLARGVRACASLLGRAASTATLQPSESKVQSESFASRLKNSIQPAIMSSLRLAYRIVRPVLRPILWRYRSFMMQPIMQELNVIRRNEESSFQGSGGQSNELTKSIEAALLSIAINPRR